MSRALLVYRLLLVELLHYVALDRSMLASNSGIEPVYVVEDTLSIVGTAGQIMGVGPEIIL